MCSPGAPHRPPKISGRCTPLGALGVWALLVTTYRLPVFNAPPAGSSPWPWADARGWPIGAGEGAGTSVVGAVRMMVWRCPAIRCFPVTRSGAIAAGLVRWPVRLSWPVRGRWRAGSVRLRHARRPGGRCSSSMQARRRCSLRALPGCTPYFFGAPVLKPAISRNAKAPRKGLSYRQAPLRMDGALCVCAWLVRGSVSDPGKCQAPRFISICRPSRISRAKPGSDSPRTCAALRAFVRWM